METNHIETLRYNSNPYYDVVFNINEKKKTVTCQLVSKGIVDIEIMDFINNLFISRAEVLCSMDYRAHYNDRMNEVKSFIGVAKCAEEDIFDIKVGMDIAYKQARLKRHSYQMQILQDYIDMFNNVNDKIKAFKEAKKHTLHQDIYARNSSGTY